MKALTHVSPVWAYDHDADTERYIWGGHMRVVRSRKRMRRLKRRGVPMLHLGYGDGTPAQQTPTGRGLVAFGPWGWFESFETRDKRMLARQERAQVRFLKRNPGLPS
jgi:hypothetical protein